MNAKQNKIDEHTEINGIYIYEFFWKKETRMLVVYRDVSSSILGVSNNCAWPEVTVNTAIGSDVSHVIGSMSWACATGTFCTTIVVVQNVV